MRRPRRHARVEDRMVVGDRVAAIAPVGRDQRPEWVSWSPTTKPSSFDVRGDVRIRRARRATPRGRRRSSGRSRADGGWRARRAVTATASPPQTSLAPLSPKRRHRRRTRSVGEPSGSPSHPSIGSTANRLPTVRVPVGSVGEREGRRERPVGVDGVVDAELLVDAEHARTGRAARRSSGAASPGRCRVGHSIASSRSAMSREDGAVAVGAPRRARRCRVGRDPAAELTGTAPRRGGTRAPVPGTRRRRGTAAGR